MFNCFIFRLSLFEMKMLVSHVYLFHDMFPHTINFFKFFFGVCISIFINLLHLNEENATTEEEELGSDGYRKEE